MTQGHFPIFRGEENVGDFFYIPSMSICLIYLWGNYCVRNSSTRPITKIMIKNPSDHSMTRRAKQNKNDSSLKYLSSTLMWMA